MSLPRGVGNHELTKEQLSTYFHLPITQVAKELGMCATMLKKICRKNGITRWPFRKVKSIDSMIASVEAAILQNPTEEVNLNHELAILRNKRDQILKDPERPVNQKLPRLVSPLLQQPQPPPQSPYTVHLKISGMEDTALSMLGDAASELLSAPGDTYTSPLPAPPAPSPSPLSYRLDGTSSWPGVSLRFPSSETSLTLPPLVINDTQKSVPQSQVLNPLVSAPMSDEGIRNNTSTLPSLHELLAQTKETL